MLEEIEVLVLLERAIRAIREKDLRAVEFEHEISTGASPGGRVEVLRITLSAEVLRYGFSPANTETEES